MAEITSTINGIYPGVKLKGNDRYKKLYHYTSFDTFVKIWLTKQLKFGIISNVNDIQEAEISCQISNFQQYPIMYAYQNIRNNYKQISLTMDYDSYLKGCMSPMMWGHYGDKRKGVCIELDFNEIKLPDGCLKGEVKYKAVLPKYFKLDPKIKNEIELRKFINKRYKELFFTKQSSWKGEKEFRIVSDIVESIDIEKAISAVYLTSCDSLECILVEKLVANRIPVMYLKYNSSGTNLAIPVVTDTCENRESIKNANENPENALNTMRQQALEIYESARGDQSVSLLQKEIFFKKE